MSIIYLNHQAKSVTGGHKYNDAFIEYLHGISGLGIEYTPSCAILYPSWRKIFSPLAELKRLSLFRKGSFVFWSDTSYKHHLLLAIVAKLCKKIHSSIIVHHFLFLGEKGIRRYIMLALQYIYILLFDDIIVPSPYTWNVAKRLFPKKSIYYVPLPFKQDFSITSEYEKGNLIYVGTIEERKGLKYLLDAFEIILDKNPEFCFKLNIVGKIVDHSYYKKLNDKIKELGIIDKVTFCGRVSDIQLEECYRKAEIFVFPSLLEGYGIVLVEAMSKGLPIVAFNNSAMPYSIHDGENGLLARNKDSQSFADKLLTICGNDSLRHHLQKGMKETIDNLKTQKDFEEGIRNFYNNVSGLKG